MINNNKLINDKQIIKSEAISNDQLEQSNDIKDPYAGLAGSPILFKDLKSNYFNIGPQKSRLIQNTNKKINSNENSQN